MLSFLILLQSFDYSMSKTLPNHLKSTARLLEAAYAGTIPENDYPAIVAVLYEHLSDRNLAEVLCHFTAKDSIVVWNDIGRIMSVEKPGIEDVSRVRELLEKVGLRKWISNQ